MTPVNLTPERDAAIVRVYHGDVRIDGELYLFISDAMRRALVKRGLNAGER